MKNQPTLTQDHGWLRAGGLLYRLTDERRPTNRDEIQVTLADGSRTPEACQRRAGELLDMLSLTPATAMENKEHTQLLGVIAEWKAIARVQSAKLHAALDEPGARERLQTVLQETKLATPDPVVPTGWKVESVPPWSALTDEANADRRWLVTRTEAPYCNEAGHRQWNGPTLAEALRRAHEAMGLPPTPAPVAQREHGLIDVRCECCGYMTYHREHMGCIRAAAPAPVLTPAQSHADELLAALRKIADDCADRLDLDSPSTNPGIKFTIEQGRSVLAKIEATSQEGGK